MIQTKLIIEFLSQPKEVGAVPQYNKLSHVSFVKPIIVIII